MSLFGIWKLKTSTKFDEYMKEVGVNWALRKAGAACSSTTEITQVYFDIYKNEIFYEVYDPGTESLRSLCRKNTIGRGMIEFITNVKVM